MIDFQEGYTMLVDKPYEWTSFDVVNKLRWNIKQKLGVKKIKVGHAGTLDPLATGLLVICTGKNTKLIEGFTNDQKIYTGTFLLGKTTPSSDLETEFNEEFPTDHITDELLEEVRKSFIGVQQQVPPIFSAKQVDGQRAYDLARAGKEVVLKSNTVEIIDFQITANRFPEIDVYIHCSKGTYIRSIAFDFGRKLNSGATMIALRRTASGDFKIENSKTVEEWIEYLKEN
ncbi:MAG: tRNA pseudouridine(55) synthase TruB [Crocinitomicaceae bacterium]|nr:tRNA pseudouridine(55) synthase TruB [Crocinitomicaceae bacterium]